MIILYKYLGIILIPLIKLNVFFRIFQGKAAELIRGEGTSKSAEAVQGKVALHVLNDF